MNNVEQLEQNPENLNLQKMLLQKGDEFFSSFISTAKKSFRDDRSFTTAETQYNLIWKPLMLFFSVTTGQGGISSTIETADQLVDSLYELGEKADTAVELGPDFIVAYVKSGLKDINEFLQEVADGKIIF